MQTTFPRLLLDHAAGRPEAPALREKDLGIWQAIQLAAAFRDEVEALAAGLVAPEVSSAASTLPWSARTGRACTRR